LAGEQHFLGEIAEEGFQDESGGVEERGAMHGGGEGAGEVGVGNGVRCAEVERAGDGGVFGGPEDEADLIGDVDPGHPLTAAAEVASDAKLERAAHQGEGSAFITEHKAGAEIDDAGAEAVFCKLGGGFPGDANLSEKATAGGAGFGEDFVAAITIVADTGGDEEGGRGLGPGGEVVDKFFGEGAATFVNEGTFGVGPEAENGFAGEVDENIQGAVRLGESPGGLCGLNEAVGAGTAAAGVGDDLVTALGGEFAEVGADEAGGSCDADAHEWDTLWIGFAREKGASLYLVSGVGGGVGV
jgi:hypothetical protein